jgi:uncharacterized coiled-coil protein SlyX
MRDVDPDRIEFEAKVTFLERTVEVMHDTLLEQGRILANLEQRLASIEREKRDEGEDLVGDLRPHNDPPPHY